MRYVEKSKVDEIFEICVFMKKTTPKGRLSIIILV